MAIQVLIHVANEDPILCEVEKLPAPTDMTIMALNPRARDNKDLRYLAPNVTQVIWPMTRITFIEIMPAADEEKIVGFVRE
jgi:hypothetical protein